MSNITGVVRARATVEAAATPNIYNLTAALANTEYSQTLTSNTKSFIIRARNLAKLQIAFISGNSGTTFMTIPPGVSYAQDNISYGGTIYFQSSKPSTIVEIVEWV